MTTNTPKGRQHWTPDRIMRLRYALGRLSQGEFAERVRVSKFSVTMWETGQQVPSAMNQLALEELENKGE